LVLCCMFIDGEFKFFGEVRAIALDRGFRRARATHALLCMSSLRCVLRRSGSRFFSASPAYSSKAGFSFAEAKHSVMAYLRALIASHRKIVRSRRASSPENLARSAFEQHRGDVLAELVRQSEQPDRYAAHESPRRRVADESPTARNAFDFHAKNFKGPQRSAGAAAVQASIHRGARRLTQRKVGGSVQRVENLQPSRRRWARQSIWVG